MAIEAPHRPDFFTIGYQGRSLEVLIDALRAAEVACLLDVRFNPVSMYRPEFSKRNLEAALWAAGIDYVHKGELGVPSDIRRLAELTGRRQDVWDWYGSHVLFRHARNLGWFFNSSDHPIAILCVEREPSDCHRHLLAHALQQQGLTSQDI